MSRLSTVAIEPEVLANLAVGQRNGSFVWDKLMPLVKVSAVNGSVPKFGQESFISFQTQRALGAGANSARISLYGKVPYELESYQFAYVADKLEIAGGKNVDIARKALTDAISAIELGREIKVATLATTAANYPTNNKITLSDDYLNESTVDPVSYIRTKAFAMENECGQYPNTLIMDTKVWQLIQINPKLIENYFPTLSSKLVTVEIFAELLGIANIVISKAKYKATKEQAGVTSVWGNNIVLAYVASPQGDLAPSEYTPSFGYLLEYEAGRTDINVIDEVTGNSTFSSSIEYNALITGDIAGYLIKNPIDPALF